jgi:maleylacetate reductase
LKTTFTIDALPQERVFFGSSVREALASEVARLGASRVFIAASKSLYRGSSAVSLVASTLGNKCVAIFDGIEEHSKLDGLLQAIGISRDTKADLLVGIGGGSIIDGLKVVQLALAENATTYDELMTARRNPSPAIHAIRQIAIPTTLSGAETTPGGGGTDTKRGQKLGFGQTSLIPRSVIYDPSLAGLTPEWLWLSSAIRGVDHCCEGFLAKNANPVSDAGFTQALNLFSSSLRRTKQVAGDPFARGESQVAAWLACSNFFRTGSGASHGIGYVLGGRYGVHHGYGSCVMLPHVLRWNEPSTSDRQKMISHALQRPALSAGDAVAELISDLGLPSRLRDVGIKESDLDTIATEAATLPVVQSNPRPITGPADVMEILRSAW